MTQKPLKRSAAELIANMAETLESFEVSPAAALRKPVRAPAPPKVKPDTRQLAVYLSQDAYKQLRDIAFHEDCKMHPLILEGLDLVFKSRGRPAIASVRPKPRE